jgi:hypothetical protein
VPALTFNLAAWHRLQGGGTCVEAHCDDLRATRRGDRWREAHPMLEEVEMPNTGAVWEVTWLEGGPTWEAEPTQKEGTM